MYYSLIKIKILLFLIGHHNIEIIITNRVETKRVLQIIL